ncbi:hypothetical protein Fisuc_1617 [Fibrobacter succinogenes subsp. succinogenes S85]|uniref:Lipoprotein n=1 Tax=Fibrobacter succinogenes (strain ATCC 19169 / S85) TaxID=59374 RepID=A0ABM5LI73_FIBSS|nr:hypothetical protein Fisuc_1617 [Fibrobacter succinogenes subsp. succinogenes S85]
MGSLPSVALGYGVWVCNIKLLSQAQSLAELGDLKA